MAAEITPFGIAADGTAVQRITLRGGGLTVAILTWGAVVQDLRLAGADWPLTLGSPDLAAYEGPMGFFGAVVGPVANRIGGAAAMIAGRRHDFPANEGTTLLHGGAVGTYKRHWQIVSASEDTATLRLILPDGTDGFPGRRELMALFTLGAGGAFGLALSAVSDAPTLVNLTNHSHWSLDGPGGIAGQRLTVAADRYLPVTDAVLPTGEVRPVSGVFDLRQGRTLDLTEGYDHNFCLAPAARALTPVAELVGRRGVRLRIATTEPGLQVYDGRHITSGGFVGLDGRPYDRHDGIALETQMWPDAPNHPAFPPILLMPGETRGQETVLRFDRV